MASSLYGGREPALLATLICSGAFVVLFVPTGFHAAPFQASIKRFGAFFGARLLTIEIIETERRSDRLRIQLAENFRSLATTSPDGIVLIDRTGVIRFFNPAIVQMCGFSPSQIEGQPVTRLLPNLAKTVAPSDEFAALRADGGRFDVEATCGAFGDTTTVFLRDISERTRARRELEQSEETVRLALETIPDLVYTQLPDGTINYVNWRARAISVTMIYTIALLTRHYANYAAAHHMRPSGSLIQNTHRVTVDVIPELFEPKTAYTNVLADPPVFYKHVKTHWAELDGLGLITIRRFEFQWTAA